MKNYRVNRLQATQRLFFDSDQHEYIFRILHFIGEIILENKMDTILQKESLYQYVCRCFKNTSVQVCKNPFEGILFSVCLKEGPFDMSFFVMESKFIKREP